MLGRVRSLPFMARRSGSGTQCATVRPGTGAARRRRRAGPSPSGRAALPSCAATTAPGCPALPAWRAAPCAARRCPSAPLRPAVSAGRNAPVNDTAGTASPPANARTALGAAILPAWLHAPEAAAGSDRPACERSRCAAGVPCSSGCPSRCPVPSAPGSNSAPSARRRCPAVVFLTRACRLLAGHGSIPW